MLMPSPEEIKFECMCDLVDYTAKGMIPKKSDFNKVMVQLRNPSSGPRDPQEVYISTDIVPDDPETRELVANVLERVYEDRKKNRKNMLILCGVLAIAFIGGAIFVSRRHKHHEESSMEHFFKNGMDCESISMNCEI